MPARAIATRPSGELMMARTGEVRYGAPDDVQCYALFLRIPPIPPEGASPRPIIATLPVAVQRGSSSYSRLASPRRGRSESASFQKANAC